MIGGLPERNAAARSGDRIILGKPLGVGVYGAAVKKQKVTDAQYRELVASTTQLNTPGIQLARLPGVHAMTDVTGFGLLGHLLEVCRGSGVRATVRWNSIPLFSEARELVSAGYVTGASARNWLGCASLVNLTSHGAVEQALLTDPQTSGGLLVACAPEAVNEVLDCFHADGFHRAAVIGDVESGLPGVSIV